ncbi:MAG: hypothetical protein IPP74_14285 [Alphaproteobacteria bacterium]|nr:hypothetical protein [Alphaproteobacteria bacterium]
MTDAQLKQLVIDKMASLSEKPYIPFSNWNCNDIAGNSCSGWDMTDYRCECGNRRVMWVVNCENANDATIDDLYAEAY